MRNLLFVALALCGLAGPAAGFGTIDGAVPGGPKQYREHEWITRRAFACAGVDNPLPDSDCFQDAALDMIAGKKGTLGAIGWTDVLHFDDHAYHCDNGDYLDNPGRAYPRPRADASAALDACRALVADYLDDAVADARKLVTGGRPNLREIPHDFCNFDGEKGDGVCNVFEDFGAALHAVQDFYSHSNWVDKISPSALVALDNPPGLGNAAPADWFDFSRDVPLPRGAMTGCYAGGDQGRGGCAGRVTHFTLNKDLGSIPLQGPVGPGTTPRGLQADNFARAVAVAIADTRRQWAYLRSRLIAAYGPEDGRTMACILENAIQSAVKARCQS